MTGPFDLTPWSGLELVSPADGGNRSEVWRGRLRGREVAVRRSRRTSASLDWELDLLANLEANGFVVPAPVPADDGRRRVDRVVVQAWLPGGKPGSEADWRRVATELQRLHRLTAGHGQRPGCCRVGELGRQRRSVDADLDAIPEPARGRLQAIFSQFDDVPAAVVHGDPGPGNLRLDGRGRVGFLDWDESRVDVIWHDLSELGVMVLGPEDQARARRLSAAWEAANAWVLEPEYAARRLRSLGPER